MDPHGLGSAVTRLGPRARRSGATPLLMVAALLDEAEVVECAVVGRYEGETAAAVLTDRRLLLANERTWSPSVERVAVDQSLVVQGWQDERTASLTFATHGRELVLDQIGDKPLAIEIAGRIRFRTGRA